MLPVLIVFVTLSVLAYMLAALLAAAETSVLLLPPGRVHRLVESQTKGAEQVEVLVERRYRLRAVSAFVACSAAAIAGVAACLFAIEATWRTMLMPAAAAATAALLVAALAVAVGLGHSVAQAGARTVAAANPERVALATAPLVLPVVSALYPATDLLGAFWRWVAEAIAKERLTTGWAVTSESRASSDEESEREEAEEALLEAVSDFAEKVVREIMVPRTDVSALGADATVAEAVARIHSTGYSRLPVYRETIDDICGVLFAKDLLVALEHGDSDIDLADIARTPFFVPETKPVEELLFEMRATTHIAIVADEYGGTSGIVTLEDLLEEIVGDISDEYDSETPLIVELGGGRYRVDAMLPVDDLNELFGTDLATEADSVGGLFTEVVGRIPDLGESAELEGLRITVLERQGTRIRQLSVEPAEVKEGS